MTPGRQGTPSIVITYPHTLGAGGGGTVGCLHIAKHLRAAGAGVVVVPVQTMTLDHKLFRNPKLGEEFQGREQEADLRAAGVEVVRVPPSRVHWMLDGRPTLRMTRSLVAGRRVDAVLGWHHEFSFVPGALGRRVVTGQFVAGWYRDFETMKTSSRALKNRLHLWLQRELLLRSLRRVDVVFAISEFTRGEVSRALKIPADRFRVAHWGVDPVFARAGREPPARISRFLFYGSPARRKGGFETLEAFAEVADRGQRDWTLVIVWPYRDELERSARDKGIADRVVVKDPMDHAGLARELAQTDVAILPSTFESFGLACAESLTSGVPVIAYDCGGVSEVVHDGESGWLVPNARPDLLPDAILDAMRDPARTHRMGLAGRQWVTARYSWDRTATTILGSLQALIDRRAV